jgi:hypothetical protein
MASDAVPNITLDDKDVYSRCLALCAIHEGQLQSYRSLLLTSESILFAIGMFAVQGAHPWIGAVAAIFALILNARWGPMTEDKRLSVTYFQWQLLRIEAQLPVDDKVLTAFNAWEHLSIHKRKEHLHTDPIGRELLGTAYMRTHDKAIPGAFQWCSIFLLVISIGGTVLKLLSHFHLHLPWMH